MSWIHWRAALAALLTCACVLGVAAPASQALALRATPGYTFIRIDHPRAASVTGPTTIAENGDVAGFYTDAGGRSHGFVRSGATGAYTDIDVPGARDTYALGLNAHGDVSGTYIDAAGAQHGFVRDAGGGFRTIDVPGAVSTSPATSEFGTGLGTAVGAIRDDGAVTGAWGTAAGASHGFLLAPGHPRVDLDAPGASTAMATSSATSRPRRARRCRPSICARTACATGSTRLCCRPGRSRRRRSRSTRRATSAGSRSASTASAATAGSGRTARTSASTPRRCF